MKGRSRPAHRLIPALAIITGLTACADQPTAPAIRDALFAKGGGGGGGGGSNPTVTVVDPSSAPQDTTLDIHVLGTGYDNGTTVELLLDGKATQKVRTNSTTFVSGTEVIANVTIAIDAEPDLYDVEATTLRGKKGVGIELFAIEGPLADFIERPTEPAPAGLYEDGFGPYTTGSPPVGNNPNDTGNFGVTVNCDDGRLLDLELPDDWTFAGPQRCAKIFHVPGLWLSDCPDGCPVGGPPDGYNYSPSVYLYFLIDAGNRGKVELTDAHNVVWTDATIRSLRWAADGTACAWRVTGSTGDLWLRPDILLETGGQVALDVTVTRFDGPCATVIGS